MENIYVGNQDVLTFRFIDVFQNVITKQFPIQHIDTINPTASASVSGGYYGNEIIVSLSMSEPGTIYYTLNEEDSSLSSIKYTGPIKINKDTVLKFMAVDASGNKSEIYTEKYRIFKVAQITDQSKEIIGKASPNSTVKNQF